MDGHRRGAMVLLAAAAALAACGCEGQVSPEAKQLWQSGLQAYNRDDDRTAIVCMDKFLQDNARSRWAGRAFHLRGLAKYRLKDYEGAKSDLSAAADRDDEPRVAAQAYKALGDLAYERDELALAEQNYVRALERMDRGQTGADEAMYRLGCLYQRQGRWSDADRQFDRLIYVYDGSALARQAARRTHCAAWTIQAGAFDNLGNAQRAAGTLKTRHLPAEVQPDLRDGQGVFRVLVGRHQTYEGATAELPVVRKHVGDAYVVPTE